MSNKIYQKIALCIIAYLHKYFNSNLGFIYRRQGRGFIKIATMFLCVLLSLFSFILTLIFYQKQSEPSIIEVYCPEDFNETIEKVREEIGSLRIP
jgi:hypothetical protein